MNNTHTHTFDKALTFMSKVASGVKSAYVRDDTITLVPCGSRENRLESRSNTAEPVNSYTSHPFTTDKSKEVALKHPRSARPQVSKMPARALKRTRFYGLFNNCKAYLLELYPISQGCLPSLTCGHYTADPQTATTMEAHSQTSIYTGKHLH